MDMTQDTIEFFAILGLLQAVTEYRGLEIQHFSVDRYVHHDNSNESSYSDEIDMTVTSIFPDVPNSKAFISILPKKAPLARMDYTIEFEGEDYPRLGHISVYYPPIKIVVDNENTKQELLSLFCNQVNAASQRRIGADYVRG